MSLIKGGKLVKDSFVDASAAESIPPAGAVIVNVLTEPSPSSCRCPDQKLPPPGRAFEDTFLHEMEVRLPEVLGEFKKGNLPEDGIKKMVALADELKPRFA